ncbi:MAG: flagellar biosynthesis regulator FlaF [Marivibrio sp.]|uniref:flagellar biosynthesis regulator FlaF n=1 Tax=Marivibrio sp. TaxID=2039719 RepID=UPI0032EDB9CA
MNTPYASQQRQALNNAPPQAAEGWALIEMARRIDEAKRAEPGSERDAQLTDLVRRNWRMWTLLQAALVDPECTVPLEIRQNLLNLSNFIDKRSVDLLAEMDAAKLDVLVNINRQIGAGLMGNPSDDPAEAARLKAEAAERQKAVPDEAEAAGAPAPSAPTTPGDATTDTEA